MATPVDPLRIAAERLRLSANGDWYDDPVGWARNCIDWPEGEGLTDYQAECMQAVVDHKRASVRGPHGLGKTTMQALLILWFATTREKACRDGTHGIKDWKIATTAGAWRQLTVFLWPEIHKWARRLRTDMIGRGRFTRQELLAQMLKLEHGQAFAVASDDPSLIEGVHADAVLYLFDESKSIIAGTFDAAEGALVNDQAYAVAMSTPGEPRGRFYDIHARKRGFEDWWVRHVTLDEVMAAGRLDQKWVENRALQWGRESAVFANRVLGEFHSSDEDGVIPLSWVEAAQLRYREWKEAGQVPVDDGPRTVGVDVARGGDDKTMLAPRDGWLCRRLRPGSTKDTMELTGQVKGMLDVDAERVAIVDVIGIGAGVVDRLREQKMNVIAFHAAEGTDKKDRSGELGFTNCRSAAWWNLRELLDPAYDSTVALPDEDDKLIGDLTTPKWRVLSGGKIQVESKDDLKKRNDGRSTDYGDAVVQAFWDGANGGASAWLKYMETKLEQTAVEPTPPPDDRAAARQAAFAGGAYR